MAVTVLETLMNAEINLENIKVVSYHPLGGIPMRQLHNAIVLLEKGYGAGDLVDPLLEQYGDVENVPEKGEDHGQG